MPRYIISSGEMPPAHASRATCLLPGAFFVSPHPFSIASQGKPEKRTDFKNKKLSSVFVIPESASMRDSY